MKQYIKTAKIRNKLEVFQEEKPMNKNPKPPEKVPLKPKPNFKNQKPTNQPKQNSKKNIKTSQNVQRRRDAKSPVSKQGAQFFVIIWEGKAIKSPRKQMTENELQKLAEIQNSLSSIEGVPKTNYSNGLLVEDLAPGDTLKNLTKEGKISKEETDFILQEQNRIVEEIKQKGYVLKDRNRNNILYDTRTKKVTLIDYYDIKSVSNLTKNAWAD